MNIAPCFSSLSVEEILCKQSWLQSFSIYIYIYIRYGKIVWKTQVVLLMFLLELEIFGVAVHKIHQNSEKWWLLWGIALWKWLRDCLSHFLLLWLWCQRFWGISEESYRSKRLSQMLLTCYSLLNRQKISINI